MILEFSLDYRSSSLVYEKIFLKYLKKHNLNGKIVKNGFSLKLYVEADSVEVLEEFVTNFTQKLPHSIFLYDNKAEIVEQMPEAKYILPSGDKLPLPFCPDCLSEVMDKNHKNYYNIFTECEVCGYSQKGENRSYKSEFEKVANTIKDGKIIKINTFYGIYFVGILSKICNDISFDVVIYDLATVEKYANVSSHEVTTLGSFEKPFIKLKTKLGFKVDYEEIENDLVRFKLPDDFVLHLLMEELHKIGIDAIFITDEKIEADEIFEIVEFKEKLEPIEVVSSENAVAIVKGEKGLPKFSITDTKVNPAIGAFNSVVKEHNLKDDDIAALYLSKENRNNLLVRGSKFGIIEYLTLNFEFSSMKDIFEKIKNSDENGVKIVENYEKKFPEHFKEIEEIVFENSDFNIFKLWGVVAIVLEYSNSKDPFEAAKNLETNAMSFLGEKGPRIDYKLKNIDGKPYLDPLMTVRTAMSFRLAGVDPLMLSYGVIESFLEFLANELDELQQSMNITAITVAGSLLSNRQIFSKMSKEISINHDIYFNNELPIEGKNIFYGGN